MSKNQFFVIVVVALLIGLTVVLLAGAANGGSESYADDGGLLGESTLQSLTQQPTETASADDEMAIPSATATPTVSRVVVAEADPKTGDDLADVVLLTDPSLQTNFDSIFCKVAEYYGLVCKQIDLTTTELTEADLQDSTGSTFELISMSAAALPQLSTIEANLLRSSVADRGVNLLIYELDGQVNFPLLRILTDNAVIDVTDHNDTVRNWVVSSDAPEITREFSGQEMQLTQVLEQADWAVELNPEAGAVGLINSVDDFSFTYPIFVSMSLGQGTVFLNAGDKGDPDTKDAALADLYYNTEHFSQIVPMMMAIRYALKAEVWHQETNYANLTMDGAALEAVYENLDYAALLQQMEEHDFHTTIALPPVQAENSDTSVLSLFLESPDRYSLVQNGNNRDGYEFYQYEVEEAASSEYPARPFFEQETDIKEGLERMLAFEQQTTVPSSRVMVFPYGISPAPTFTLLKELNYLATVNAQGVPLGETRPTDWDFDMQQANLQFESFPVVVRREYINSYQSPGPFIRTAVLDFFIDRPALFWSQPTDGQLFTKGVEEFNVIADRVNAVPGELEWRSLGYIIQHMYKEKVNDDQSIDIMMCCGQLIFTNDSSTEATYHLTKPETENVPLRRVVVNGENFPYRLGDGFVKIDIRVPAHSDVEVLIEYGGD